MVFCCFRPSTCPFCHVSATNGFPIVHEDDDLIAFHDRSPGAAMHLLVIPRQHIKNVKALDASHGDLLEKMIDLGRRLLKDHGFDPDDPSVSRLGFHIPPFNSIDHLHLHVLGLPFKNAFRTLKYSPNWWYTHAASVLHHLRQGLDPV
ncbi:HIT-like domain-containing protein [Syncephalastrum racemosum]|uniref:HIT-like domain-containing protein n=1 Tax=Syncephalastrum racemosum TaxID=13706 RepID=A0A1X2HH50_SYNRA|nr:HIT-like domain-containing protein [Syncephalastrum racemosum]